MASGVSAEILRFADPPGSQAQDDKRVAKELNGPALKAGTVLAERWVTAEVERMSQF